MDELLKVTDLHVYYGMIHAIRGISFEVKRGEIVTLIGANGAGKTTTLHTITGLLPSSARSRACAGGQKSLFPALGLTEFGARRVYAAQQGGEGGEPQRDIPPLSAPCGAEKSARRYTLRR